MTLRLTLKPGEGVLIGSSRVEVAGRGISVLLVDGDEPVLRTDYAVETIETGDIFGQIRMILQQMYLCKSIVRYHEDYFTAIEILLKETPSALAYVNQLNKYLMTGDVFGAIKFARDDYFDAGQGPMKRQAS